MSYPRHIVKWLMEEAKLCFFCGEALTSLDFSEVHSTTGLHLVFSPASNPPRDVYLVTDPPQEFSYMLGKIYELENEFHLPRTLSDPRGYKGDAVVVHRLCHDKVKKMALELCRRRIQGFSGGTPTPKILNEVSRNFKFYETKFNYLFNAKQSRRSLSK
ncbi:TPA: hypothetical protein DIU27_02355 [Candidatus Collierbacteria bacterium]|uniref:Uncharacterized protein n=1 Tax=Candidatus Collierbacteria bacterium GW2011_GWB2_44_22 TaxID=1618387 RepID=A0A0G1HZH3_9BACT|nr:MAG: hypothetical protein UW31_C0009G0060 [Candidatus Collierbacteria bacterium GW2011_GWA2_44_13]KKT49574.1 MAG: hypothetical protein UW42_C0033G0007 [Candidatus Collierbacteria bacterium GW2011_GWB1_44_197]KKT51968.1 MAG: hypothetical protein UW44_C0005G0010 [Candidatus Collierbacteria bacterium GW2011_GWB2_44_22]KKT62264.1 MAG: hypothetical protein UW56_C0009G0038 [Candidatus Collierbacteria bacterium GW2011_GWD1_44_27]KKT66610.1 MAG: hypothetical protein UW58_C0005G0006 [Candidatus Colli